MNTLFAPFAPLRDLELATRPRLTPVSQAATVPFDAVRSDEALELAFDLPGYEPADVDLTVDRNVLSLTAQRARRVAEGATLVVGERRQGSVRRQLRLSDSLDTASVEARFDNGVLHVRIPVAETAQPHKVEIDVGAAPVVESATVETGAAEDVGAN
jgi:HSP20 family protein